MTSKSIRIVRPCTFFSTDRNLKIIVVKLDHLGDFVVAIPALSRLRKRFEGADIDIVVSEGSAHFARELKYFRNIYTFDFFTERHGQDKSAELELLIAKLGKFDIAIDLRRHGETRDFLCKIPALLRVGYQSFSRCDDELDILVHAEMEESGIVKASDEDHMSLQLIRLVDSIPIDTVRLPKLCHSSPRGKQIGVFPKAGNEAREWPKAYFLELCEKIMDASLTDRLNLYFPKDQSNLSSEFEHISNVRCHQGLSMEKLIDSLVHNELVITNNSFGSHISSYLGIAGIAVYSGHELVSQWGPAFGNTTVVFSKLGCSPCHKRLIADCPYNRLCLLQITPDVVFDLVKDELKRNRSRALKGENHRYFISK